LVIAAVEALNSMERRLKLARNVNLTGQISQWSMTVAKVLSILELS
jgi:hypothetical protein